MLSHTAVTSFHDNLHQLCNELDEVARESVHPSVDKKVELAVQALEQLILTQQFSEVQQKTLLKMDTICNFAETTRRAFQYYSNDVERTAANEMIQEGKPIIAFNHALIQRKYNLIQRESHLANIQSRDHVLVLGAGMLPLTGISLAENTRARVTLFDDDSDNRLQGKKITDLFHRGKIDWTEQVDEKLLEQVNVVILTSHFHEKRKWLEEMAPFLQRGTRILCRTGFGLRGMLYPHTRLNRLNEYTRIGLIAPKKSQLEGTVYLLR